MLKYLKSCSSYWPSGRNVISLAIFKLVNISQEDWGGGARIIQIIHQKWCLYFTEMACTNLIQIQQAHGTMFFLLHYGEKFRVKFIELLAVACGIHFPDQDLLLWEHGVLATGPPGKSLGGRLIKNSAMKGQVDTIWVLRSILAPLNLGHPDIMCLLMWWYNRNCTASLVMYFWLRKKNLTWSQSNICI